MRASPLSSLSGLSSGYPNRNTRPRACPLNPMPGAASNSPRGSPPGPFFVSVPRRRLRIRRPDEPLVEARPRLVDPLPRQRREDDRPGRRRNLGRDTPALLRRLVAADLVRLRQQQQRRQTERGRPVEHRPIEVGHTAADVERHDEAAEVRPALKVPPEQRAPALADLARDSREPIAWQVDDPPSGPGL